MCSLRRPFEMAIEVALEMALEMALDEMFDVGSEMPIEVAL